MDFTQGVALLLKKKTNKKLFSTLFHEIKTFFSFFECINSFYTSPIPEFLMYSKG